MKNIYFACSISGGRDHAHLYQDIVDAIKEAGGEVLSELFADMALTAEVGHTKDMTPAEIYERDQAWVEQADGVIAEVTQPSLGVGYEVGMAESLNKPVLALFYTGSGRRLSVMIDGNPHVTTVGYKDVSQVKTAVSNFLNTL